jgi:hypothetical protein
MSGPDVGAILQVLTLAEEADAAPDMVPLGKRIEILRDTVSTM